MRNLLRIGVVLLLAAVAPACLIIDDEHHDSGFDFNGVWTFAMTGCQAQVGDATITQSGPSFVMTTSTLAWRGECDPYVPDFIATASGPWGYWTIQGRAVGENTLSGSYLYVDYRRGQCTGTFDATRTAYRGAAPESREQLHRVD